MATPCTTATLLRMNGRVRDAGRFLGLASLYVIFARLGLSLGAIAGFATLVWPPTGIAIAALLLLGTRAWPGVFVGAVVANLLSGASVPVALGIGVGNTLEALVCAYIATRITDFSTTLENARSVMMLILGALAGATVSASVGVASLHAGGAIAGPQLREAWRAWWVGDILGALVVAPVILVWSKPNGRRPRRPEALAIAAAVVLVSGVTFFGDLSIVGGLSTPFHQADLLLAVGTTLQVQPVASMVPIAARAGAQIVIVNDQPTAMDALADVVVRESIGSVLTRICAGGEG